jgi:hypothetical protein
MMALKELHWTLCKLETIYPEAASVEAGDFNKANLRKRQPKFYQHIDCSAGKTLEHHYTDFRDAYKALPCPHSANLTMTPFCSSLLLGRNSNRKYPCFLFNGSTGIQRWSDQLESTLQDCFDHVDGYMFRVASENNIGVYADSLSEFYKEVYRRCCTHCGH